MPGTEAAASNPWVEWLVAHRQKLLIQAASVVGRSDAEEVLQAVVLRLLKREQMQQAAIVPRDPLRYLVVTVRNEACNLLRKRRGERRVLESVPLRRCTWQDAYEAEPPTRRLERQELEQLFNELEQILSPQQRQLLSARRREPDRSFRSLAGDFRCTHNNLRMMWVRITHKAEPMLQNWISE